MARPAFTNIADGDVDVNSPLDTDLLDGLRDNAEAVRTQIFQVDFSVVSTSSTSFVTLATVWVYVPDLEDYTGISRTLTAPLEVRTTSGRTGTYRIYDNTSGTASTEVTTTSTTSEVKIPVLTFAASVEGTTREIQVQAKVDDGAGTSYVQCTNRADWHMDY